jgi:hypothetical protein
MEGYIAVAILATMAFIASFFVKIDKKTGHSHH